MDYNYSKAYFVQKQPMKKFPTSNHGLPPLQKYEFAHYLKMAFYGHYYKNEKFKKVRK